MAKQGSPSIGVGMIGCGTVGTGVATLLSQQAELYAQRLGKPVEIRRVLVRDPAKPAAQACLPPDRFTKDPDAFFNTDDMPIVIEVAGGIDPVAAYVRRALTMGKHVITANKSLLAEQGPDLFALAHQNNASIAFEASCGGGIPIITALQFGLMANRIDALYGILNGTSNFILTAMTQDGRPYADALRDAQAKGFAEANPIMDVSGQDAGQKLAVLASLAFGTRVSGDQVACDGIDTLDSADIRFGAEMGYDIKLLAIAQRSGSGASQGISLSVEPCFVHEDTPMAQVHGSFNALSVYGHAVGHTMYYGPGAGGLPTASAVVSDLLNTASGWYPQAFAAMRLWADQHQPATVVGPDAMESRFYLRLNAKDAPGVMAKIAKVLGDAGISLSGLHQHEAAAGQFVPVVITTHEAHRSAVRQSIDQIENLDVIDGRPVCIRIADLPG